MTLRVEVYGYPQPGNDFLKREAGNGGRGDALNFRESHWNSLAFLLLFLSQVRFLSAQVIARPVAASSINVQSRNWDSESGDGSWTIKPWASNLSTGCAYKFWPSFHFNPGTESSTEIDFGKGRFGIGTGISDPETRRLFAYSTPQEPPPVVPGHAKKKRKKYSPSATTGSPGHIFWVVPAYKVDYQKGFKPLSRHEKFQEWAESTYDPLGLSIGAIEAGTLQYSAKDGFCGYGHGWGGYGKCYGSMQLDAVDSSFIGDYALTVLLHQDPRYFRLGQGSFGKRTWYAITRVFVTHKDSGKLTFYSSALSGTTVAAAVSNLYYPQSDVGVGPTISRIGIDLGNTALYNGAAEFWPDIHRKLDQIF